MIYQKLEKKKIFFLYDESNYVNQTFYTELNKKLQIYGIISTSATGIESTTKLARPENSLKFNVVNDTYIDHIALQLEDIKNPGKIETKAAKVTNFLILSTKPKRRISSKEKISYQIIGEIKIVGLLNRSLNEKLNPVKITIHDCEIQSKLSRNGNQRYKYHFIVNSLFISSSIVQEINVIFLISNGLNNVSTSLIKRKIYKSIGVLNVNKITNWTELKGKSNWVNIVFNDWENPTLAKHFAFAFETTNLNDLLNFELSLLDDEAKPIKFPATEQKIPALTFTIQVKKTTYGAIPKNNELLKLTSDIKHAIQKIEEKK